MQRKEFLNEWSALSLVNSQVTNSDEVSIIRNLDSIFGDYKYPYFFVFLMKYFQTKCPYSYMEFATGEKATLINLDFESGYNERKEIIIDLARLSGFMNNNMSLLLEILDKFDLKGLYPQIGVTDNNIFKLYISNTIPKDKTHIQFIEKQLLSLGISSKIFDIELKGEAIECIGFDFRQNELLSCKIYTCYLREFKLSYIYRTLRNVGRVDTTYLTTIYGHKPERWGFLYRFSFDGKLLGIKSWFKFRNFPRYNGNYLSYLAYNKNVEYYKRINRMQMIQIENIRQEVYVLFLTVTNDCMFNCAYCFVDKTNPSYMSENTARKSVEILLKSPGKKKLLKLYGGEPLMNFKLIEYVVPFTKNLARDLCKDLTITVCTNMALINKNIVDYFHKENIKLALSMDGDSNSQNLFRRSLDLSDTYELIRSKLKIITDRIGQNRLAVNLTVPNKLVENLYDNVLHIFKLGVDTINIEPIMSDEWDNGSRESFKDQYLKVMNYIYDQVPNKFYFLTQLNRELRYSEISGIENGECLLKRGIQISPQGDIFLDPFAIYSKDQSKKIGNVHKGSYTNHLLCSEKNRWACKNCKDNYQLNLPINNNPTSMRNKLTINYAKKIIEKSRYDPTYKLYLEDAKKHICF